MEGFYMLKQDSRYELNDLLFDEYTTNENYIGKTEQIALKLKKAVRPIKVSGIFNNQLDLALLQDYEVYYLAKALYEWFQGGDKINPVNFFTSIEIERYENMVGIDISEERPNTIIFDNCIQVTNNMWSVSKISIQELVQLQNDSLVVYNKETQRETEKRVTLTGVKERIKVYKKSVKEIRDNMIGGSYFPTVISYNILANGFEKFAYDEEKQRLIIEVDDNSEINLIDGYHRISACAEALRINPNLEQYMQANIFHLDVHAARRYILQESKKNEINKELLSYFDTDNVASKLINDLDSEGTPTTNFIKGHLAQDLESVRLLYKYCTYETLIKSVDDNFKLDKKDIRNTRQIKEYLTEFFNELLSIYKDEFENISKSRLESFITSNNAFYGYVAMAGKLFGERKWHEELATALSKIDFNKNSDIWKGMGMSTENISKRQINSIYKLFTSFVDVEEVNEDGEKF